MSDSNTNLTDAGLSPELESVLGDQLSSILSQVPRKFNIDLVKADSGNVGDLDIDKIILGDATIDKIILTDTDARLNGADALLQNVRTVIDPVIKFEWDVDLGWFGNPGGSETLDFPNIPFSFDQISVPSLADINLHIPSVNVADTSLSIEPINNLDLGGAKLKKLVVENTDAPDGGFNLSGMSVGSVAINDVGIPKTATERISIDEFKPDNRLGVPGASASNLNIPAAGIDDIQAGGFAFSAHGARCRSYDFGRLHIKICLEPIIHMDIGSMVIKDAEFSAKIRKLDIKDIQVPLTVRGIKMRNVNLNAIKINKISL